MTKLYHVDDTSKEREGVVFLLDRLTLLTIWVPCIENTEHISYEFKIQDILSYYESLILTTTNNYKNAENQSHWKSHWLDVICLFMFIIEIKDNFQELDLSF